MPMFIAYIGQLHKPIKTLIFVKKKSKGNDWKKHVSQIVQMTIPEV